MASSSQVETLVESIRSAFTSFKPEHVVPDVEGFLEHFPEIFEAISEEWKKLAGRMEDELPIDNQVPEAMREMVPVINGQAEVAREVFATFRRIHKPDLDQHYNPRPNEAAWNVGKN